MEDNIYELLNTLDLAHTILIEQYKNKDEKESDQYIDAHDFVNVYKLPPERFQSSYEFLEDDGLLQRHKIDQLNTHFKITTKGIIYIENQQKISIQDVSILILQKIYEWDNMFPYDGKSFSLVLAAHTFGIFQNKIIQRAVDKLDELKLIKGLLKATTANVIQASISRKGIEFIETQIETKRKIEQGRKRLGKRIFIVHGHDEEMKQAAARFVSDIDFIPIILHEQANKGRTLIEKFEEEGETDFAIVLMSPDDQILSKDGDASKGKLRARQNVIFELGYFRGKLGKQNVVALYREHDEFEMPSDLVGVIYIPYKSDQNWRFDLIKELKAAGHEVDANKLMS